MPNHNLSHLVLHRQQTQRKTATQAVVSSSKELTGKHYSAFSNGAFSSKEQLCKHLPASPGAVCMATGTGLGCTTSATRQRGICCHRHQEQERAEAALMDGEWKPQGPFCSRELYHSSEQQRTFTAPAASSRPVQAFPCLLLAAKPGSIPSPQLQAHRHRSTVTMCHMCCCPSPGPQC